jgi:predicted nucleic acid-binding protein
VGRRARQHVTGEVVFASLLLDAGAVLAFARDRPEVRRWLERAQKYGIDPRVTLVTVAEVFRDRPAGGRVQWVLSRLEEEPLTIKHAHDAGRLLGATNSGDRTIDAIVAATALRMPRPVVVLTSDPKDLTRLLEGQPRVVVATV